MNPKKAGQHPEPAPYSPEPVSLRLVFNLGRSGGSHVAAEKDDMVGEAIDAEYRRSSDKP